MGFNDFLDDVGVPGVGSPPPEVQRNVMYGGRPQKKYGFLEGLRDVLGGFNAVKRIDDTGFDWREQDAARQAARDQELQKYQQANEDYLTKAGAEAAIGGMPENELESLLPAGLDPARRRAEIARMVGQSAQAKSSLKDQALTREVIMDIKGNIKTKKDEMGKACYEMMKVQYTKDYSEFLNIFFVRTVSSAFA